MGGDTHCGVCCWQEDMHSPTIGSDPRRTSSTPSSSSGRWGRQEKSRASARITWHSTADACWPRLSAPMDSCVVGGSRML